MLVVWFVVIYIIQLLNINGWMYKDVSRGVWVLYVVVLDTISVVNNIYSTPLFY